MQREDRPLALRSNSGFWFDEHTFERQESLKRLVVGPISLHGTVGLGRVGKGIRSLYSKYHVFI